MAGREQHYVLEGQIQIIDAYADREIYAGTSGRRLEKGAPFVAGVLLSGANHPLCIKLPHVSGFKRKAIAPWGTTYLAPAGTVFSNGLACFVAASAAGATHPPTAVT